MGMFVVASDSTTGAGSRRLSLNQDHRQHWRRVPMPAPAPSSIMGDFSFATKAFLHGGQRLRRQSQRSNRWRPGLRPQRRLTS